MQNSLCFIGEDASDVVINEVLSILRYMVNKCRVKKVYITSSSYFSRRLYNVISEFRKTKKVFSRVLIVDKDYIDKATVQYIYKRFESYVVTDSALLEKYNLNNLNNDCKEMFMIALSTYVVIVHPINDRIMRMYEFAKKLRKEVIMIK